MPDTKEQIALNQINRLKQLFQNEGLKVTEPIRKEYSYQINILEGSEKISLQVYFGKKGNKTLIQGNKDLLLYKIANDLIFGEKFLDDVKPEAEPEHSYIGTDESGKGDYFGPLAVAGVFISKETGKYLRSIGVRDSKEISDAQIKELALAIRNHNDIPQEVVLILPEKYNQLYEKMGNLNRMMGWAHARVIENLLAKCDAEEAISDKFGNEKIILDSLLQKGRQIQLNQVTKAERFTAVAAASILARNAVVHWFESQSKKYRIKLLKGSSDEVEKVARIFLREYGEEILASLVKLHFKTSKKIFNN